MNAVELLKSDHQEALELLDQIENAEDLETQSEPEKLFLQLKKALLIHTRVEEDVFYPALEKFDEMRDQMREAHREHEAVDRLLEEISSISVDGDGFVDKISELREKLEHHIDEEEDEIFPAAERLCGEKKLQEMGREMEQMKKKGQGAAASKRK